MRSRFVRVWRPVPFLAALLLLAGCLKLDADLTISADDTVTGTYVVAYKKDPKQQTPGLQTARPLLVHSGSADVRPYDDGQYLGSKYELRGVPFADLAAFTAVTVQGRQTGTIQLSRDGDDVLVAGTFDFRETSSVNRTAQQDAEARKLFSVRIRLTFPGDVQTANGSIQGRSVTWDIPPFVRTQLQARAAAVPPPAPQVASSGSSDAARYTLWGGVGLAGLALVLGLLLLVRRMRRPEPEPSAPEASDFAWVLGDRDAPRPDQPDRTDPRDWARPSDQLDRRGPPDPRPAATGPWDRTVAGPPTPASADRRPFGQGAPTGTPAGRGAPAGPAGRGGPADRHAGQGAPARREAPADRAHPQRAPAGQGGPGRQGSWPGTHPGWNRPANGGPPPAPPFREPPREPRQDPPRPDDPAGRP